MKSLFNSRGHHVANEVNGHLHSPSGRNVGHFREDCEVFVDMQGYYLGEIVYGNRLVHNKNSPYRSSNFGVYGDYGNVGNFGNPGNCGSIALPAGYEDVSNDKLK